MYESRREKPLSQTAFVSRLFSHLAVAVFLLVISLAIGVWGYIYFESLPVLDAFLNAAMLLGGMGPVNPPVSNAGKVFAGLFALYAGLFFLLVAALILTPIAHRVLHKYHWDE